jgi:hypothetical protein
MIREAIEQGHWSMEAQDGHRPKWQQLMAVATAIKELKHTPVFAQPPCLCIKKNKILRVTIASNINCFNI